jgi:hypothetical protein
MGAVLQQRVDNVWQPLAFFFKKLISAKQKYSAYDRELLAVYEAVKHFRHMLEARHFTIFTHHKPMPSSRNGTNAHRGNSTTSTSSPSLPPTCDTSLGGITLSPTLSLASKPSPRRPPTTHWPYRRRATTNFEHF